MSVLVKVTTEIDIGPDIAKRHLAISLLSTPSTLEDGITRDLDQVGTYEVIITGGRSLNHATFEHRYGDDVLVLIAKAGEALRAKYNTI